jgi:hypothetical protein
MANILYKGRQVIEGYWEYPPLPPAAELWTPSQLTTAIWVDGSIPGTIERSGNNIIRWFDLSGNNRHLTAFNSPQFVSGGLNGRDTVSFNGSSHSFESSSVLTSSSLFVFVVAKEQSFNATGRALLTVTNDLNNKNGFLHLLTRTDITNLQRSVFTLDAGTTGVTAITPNSTYQSGTFKMLSSSRNAATGHQYFLNGTQQGSTVSAIDLSMTNAKLILGTYFSISNGQNYHLSGEIQKVIVMTSIPDNATREKIEGWAAHDLGMESDLPSGHPYKNNPPLL